MAVAAKRVLPPVLALVLLGGLLWSGPAGAVPGPPSVVRFATFNASLNRNATGQLITDLSSPGNAQADTVAEIIQRTRPDVLLINEFDFDDQGEDGSSLAAELFQDNYLSIGQGGADPIEYPYRFVAPSNTGIPSGFDFNNNGVVGGPDDAFGFGFFPGQFGMAVYSMFPIDEDAIRTFQLFLWKDMPGALLPDDPATSAPADWYSPAELDVFRLSSKSHWDVPIELGDRTVHFLVSHPTPPVFDGPEDRNGTRNHDEIRFWADYVLPSRSDYIVDDEGNPGGLEAGASFVIAGDQNSDPFGPAPARAPAHQHQDHAPERRRRGAVGVAGRREPHARRRPPVRHGRLPRRPRAGEPSSRLRAPAEEPADRGGRGVLAGEHRPTLPAGRHLPLPELGPPAGLGRRADPGGLIERERWGGISASTAVRPRACVVSCRRDRG